MEDRVLKKVEEWIEENKMLPEHSRVIAAVSGGADSVCLLALLIHLAPAHDWKVRAFHLNHLIRGEEAERDEDFVCGLCREWQTELTVVREDVPAYARDNGFSLEEAGRKCRLRELEKAAQEWEKGEGLVPGSVRIAVAHQADDNAETILHHLLRGSGLRGLGGIRPVQGRVIRPLLCLRRDEVRDLLLQNGITWCEDSTNSDNSYTRNLIRNDMIPLMERGVNPHAVENIVHAGGLIASADETLMAQAADIFSHEGSMERGEVRISLPAFLEQNSLIRSYILRHMIDLIAPGLRDLTSRHFDMITELACGGTGKRAYLPGSLMAGRDYDTLWIRRTDPDDPESKADTGLMEETVWEPSAEGGRAGEISFMVFPRQKEAEIPRNKWSKWFDYDKIKGALSVRTRRDGDYITITGGAHKSLNRFFIDEKIPRDERDEILLLAEGSHVLWVVGMRISEYYKVTEETEYILQAEKKEG